MIIYAILGAILGFLIYKYREPSIKSNRKFDAFERLHSRPLEDPPEWIKTEEEKAAWTSAQIQGRLMATRTVFGFDENDR